MYQDKLKATILKNNGRLSSGNWTKHICEAMENLEVKYCPTGKILAGYFTKPLQGDDFQKFRAEI